MKAKILKNFISKEEAEILTHQIKQNIILFTPCEQCKGSIKKHNFKPAVWLLASKTKEISDLVGEKVLPSYCYTRVYKKDTELRRHIDRTSCEITVSIHLYGDKPWNLLVEEDKKFKAILDIGDALIYDGVNNYHSREEKYKGEEYINIFLHYVKLNGLYNEQYFEK